MSLDLIDFDKVIAKMTAPSVLFADIFFEEKVISTLVYENRRVDRVRKGVDCGIGLRIIKDNRTFHGFTTDINQKSVDELCSSLLEACRITPGIDNVTIRPEQVRKSSIIEIDPSICGLKEKIDLLEEADDAARRLGNEITQVRVVLMDEKRRVLQINSEGSSIQFDRTTLTFLTHVTAAKDSVLQTGYESAGGQFGMEFFKTNSVSEIASTAASRALTMLRAREAPSGRMPVVLSSDAGGTMIHEAVGHGLELDFVVDNMTVYAKSLGQKIASDVISVVDDPTLPNRRGSYPYDDEGIASKTNLLIENGVLKAFMSDRLSALKKGVSSSGNGRRESYRHRPIPRMSNTLIVPSTMAPDDVLNLTPKGLLVKKMGGGQVNTVNGDFVFEVAEGYLIENGKQGPAVRGATLVGNGPRVLRDIDMVANDLGFSIGTCGKDGQGAPVSDAQPTLRIGTPDIPETWITVGGTA
ncbi:MAG: TldD/PmbA family protein [Syntrophaceae bacterium]|nr:TldD/PmbA family protein [Syntrophaceae bacterium]